MHEATQKTPYRPSINELLTTDSPLIPPGKYYVTLNHWKTCIVFKNAKKIMLFFTINDGEFAGITLRAFYGVNRLIGKPRKNGRFCAGRMSNFAREFLLVMESRGIFIPNIRYDRLPISHLAEKPILVKVRTVTEVQAGKLALQAQYSVIDKMLGS